MGHDSSRLIDREAEGSRLRSRFLRCATYDETVRCSGRNDDELLFRYKCRLQARKPIGCDLVGGLRRWQLGSSRGSFRFAGELDQDGLQDDVEDRDEEEF